MSKLDELRKLEAGASLAPWFYDKNGKPERELDSLDDPNVPHGDIWMWDKFNGKPHRTAVAESIWLNGIDGELIVAMRNHLPALLRVVEAAKAMSIELTPEQRSQWEPFWLEKYDKVIAALRELEGE